MHCSAHYERTCFRTSRPVQKKHQASREVKMVPFAISEQSVTNDVDHGQLTNSGCDDDANVHLPKQGYFPRDVSQVNPLMESSLPSLQPARFDSQIFSDEYRKPGFFQLLLRGEIDDSLSCDFGLPETGLSEFRLSDAGLIEVQVARYRIIGVQVIRCRIIEVRVGRYGVAGFWITEFLSPGFSVIGV